MSIVVVHRAFCMLWWQDKVAKWWIPDDVAFVKEIPHTATGKVYKLKLRQQFKDFKFGGSKL